MASFIYDNAREKFLDGEFSWARDDIRVAILRSIARGPGLQTDVYVPSEGQQLTPPTIGNIPVRYIINTAGVLYSKTSTRGIAGAAPVTFNEIATGTEIVSVIIYKNTPSVELSYLIAHIDTQLTTGSTGQVTINWNIVNNKPWIFRI